MKRSITTWRTAFAAWKAWSESSGDDLTLLQLMAINRATAHLKVKDHNIALGFILGYMNAKKRGRK